MTVLLVPEIMTRFCCNRQGCCCQGWRVTIQPADLIRIFKAYPEDQHDRLLNDMQLLVNEQREVTEARLRMHGPEGACAFLTPQKLCRLQLEKGPAVLPTLCRAFPTYTWQGLQGLELHFDPVCPVVLDGLDEADGPLTFARIDVTDEHPLAGRTGIPFVQWPLTVGDQTLTTEQFDGLRCRILAALDDRSRPALDRLAQITVALGQIADRCPPESFSVDMQSTVPGFAAYFDQCRAIHHEQVLVHFFERYRRFVHSVVLPERPIGMLLSALRHPSHGTGVADPYNADLQPWLFRYLTLRFFTPFNRSRDSQLLTFAYGSITQTLATGFRLMAGLSEWLQQPCDRRLLKVAVGAAEYLYRSVRVPPMSMPWFDGTPRPLPND